MTLCSTVSYKTFEEMSKQKSLRELWSKPKPAAHAVEDSEDSGEEQSAAEPPAKRTATSTVPTSDTETVEVSTSAAGAGGSTSSIATCAAPVAVPATAFDIAELLGL